MTSEWEEEINMAKASQSAAVAKRETREDAESSDVEPFSYMKNEVAQFESELGRMMKPVQPEKELEIETDSAPEKPQQARYLGSEVDEFEKGVVSYLQKKDVYKQRRENAEETAEDIYIPTYMKKEVEEFSAAHTITKTNT